MALELYSDLNPEVSRGALSTGVDSVFAAIDNLLSTDRDERPFLLDFTANVDRLLFSPLDPAVAFEIYSLVAGALERFEPRARLDERNSTVRVNASEDGYDIELSLRISGYEDDHVVYRAFAPRLS